jgi:hypothetical protein
MSQRTPQRFAAAALAAVLFLAAAAPVQARDPGPVPRPWQWLQDLWTKGGSVLWYWNGLVAPVGETSRDLQKEGLGADPDGANGPGPGSAAPSGGTSGDAGPGSDPDG